MVVHFPGGETQAAPEALEGRPSGILGLFFGSSKRFAFRQRTACHRRFMFYRRRKLRRHRQIIRPLCLQKYGWTLYVCGSRWISFYSHNKMLEINPAIFFTKKCRVAL
jgi:hypothetical protein